MSPRNLAAALLVAALAVAAVPSAAFAATTSVTDPAGDATPDILRLTLTNNTGAVVLKQKYADIADVQSHNLFIKWGQTTHYRVNVHTFEGVQGYLTLSRADGDKSKSCPTMTATVNQDTDVLTAKIPRSCLAQAPDRIFAHGSASMGLWSIDEIARTVKVDRG